MVHRPCRGHRGCKVPRLRWVHAAPRVPGALGSPDLETGVGPRGAVGLAGLAGPAGALGIKGVLVTRGDAGLQGSVGPLGPAFVFVVRVCARSI